MILAARVAKLDTEKQLTDLRQVIVERDATIIRSQEEPDAAKGNLINAEVFDALGPKGFLVNVARGTIVDEDALVAALQDKRIAGAAVDVFRDEPNAPEALMATENIVMTPHIASSTHETRRAMADLVLANLRAHFAGEPVPTPVPDQR